MLFGLRDSREIERGAMSESPQPVPNLPATIERLLLNGERGATMDWCTFRVRFDRDSGYVFVRVFDSVADARAAFATHGHRFDAPMPSAHVEHADGTITYHPPPPPAPPILSNESMPNLADENFVWRGYGNTRGVIKLRAGRFVADINLPTVDDAERFAHRVVALLNE